MAQRQQKGSTHDDSRSRVCLLRARAALGFGPRGRRRRRAGPATTGSRRRRRPGAGGDAQRSTKCPLLREQRQEIERRARVTRGARRRRVARARGARRAGGRAPRAGATSRAPYTKDGDKAAFGRPGGTARRRGAGAQAGIAWGGRGAGEEDERALSTNSSARYVRGDLRLPGSDFGQLNALPNSETPPCSATNHGAPPLPPARAPRRARTVGRESSRHLRREGKKQLGREFEWGLRLATGNFPDVISSNQTLTDFFSRKAFALDQAYVTYKPARIPGFQVQAGKFDVPWLRTEMTIDNDLTVEGLNESYARSFKKSALRSLTFAGSPILERNSASSSARPARKPEQSGRGARLAPRPQFRALRPTKTRDDATARPFFRHAVHHARAGRRGNCRCLSRDTRRRKAPAQTSPASPPRGDQSSPATPTSASPSPRTTPRTATAASPPALTSSMQSRASTTRAASAGPSCCSSTSSGTRRRTTWCWPGGRAARTASCPTTKTPASGPNSRWAARSSAASTSSATRSRASRRTPC